MRPRIFRIASWAALGLAISGPSTLVVAHDAVATQRGDDSGNVFGTFEMAPEFEVLGREVNRPSPARPPKPEPTATPFDYEAAVDRARKAGDPIKAAILQGCGRVPSGTTVTVAPGTAALMRQYCTQRDFAIAVDRGQMHAGPVRTGPVDPPAETEREDDERRDPAVDACREETLAHVITCAKVTDYQNCEPWGCPEIIQCDDRLTSCDDHGAPYDQSGEFYCDTRNWRTRDFDLNALLARTCPEP